MAYLHPLHFTECFREFILGVAQAVDAVSQKDVHRRIQRESIEQGVNVDRLALTTHHPKQLLHMCLKELQIRYPAFHELRPNQLPAAMPEISISGEDAVTQKIFPVFMEWLPLAVITELSCENGLHVLRLRRENEALTAQGTFRRRLVGFGAREQPCPELVVSMLGRMLD